MTMPRRMIAVTALVIGVAAGWIFVLPARPAAQPIAFSHAHHQALSCAGCHRGVEIAARATLPGPGVCTKCHATPPRGLDPTEWHAFESGVARWTRVTHVPDHVMFSHRRHVSLAKLDCQSCHADIGRRTQPPGRTPIRLDMATCRACHSRERASEDCAACHR